MANRAQLATVLMRSCRRRPVNTFSSLRSLLVRSCSSLVDQRSPLNYVNGKPMDASSADVHQLLYPATGQFLREVIHSDERDVDQAVMAAVEAQKGWAKKTGFERGKILRTAAQRIRDESEALAKAEVLDTGKPLWEARSDVALCADTLDYFGGIAPTVKGHHIPCANGSYVLTMREPVGVVAAIGAWNYPFQMACWKSAPALACGNAVVFKPAPTTPQTAAMLARIYTESGVPDGVFNVTQGGVKTGKALTTHRGVSKLSFTGSVRGGQQVMASGAEGVKHVTLELGGKSPLLVFKDADLESAVTGAMLGNWLSCGQVCSNCTRVYVERAVIGEFLDRLVQRTAAMTIGDPMREDVTIGATITKEHAEKVLQYVELGKQEGARVLYGGTRYTDHTDPSLSGGNYLIPCILTDCSDQMRVVREEVFGAVVCVLPFDSESEAVERANDSEFGLSAGVFTKDGGRMYRVVSQLEAGTVYVNNYNVNPVEMPFGGIKMSGLGRELGEAALESYTHIKSVYVEANPLESPF